MKKKIANAQAIPGFGESLEQMEPESRIFVDKSLAIAHYLQLLLQQKGLRQKDLADMLGKSEPEISKWLTGMQNYTLRTLSKLEAALGSDIISVPKKIELATPEITQKSSFEVRGNRREDPTDTKELTQSNTTEAESDNKANGNRLLSIAA